MPDPARPLADRSAAELAELLAAAQDDYEALKNSGLSLDLTRGKPAPQQLDLSADLLTAVTADSFTTPSGVDTRNYGGLAGIVELREIFSELLGIPVPQLLAQGSSSLTLMQSCLTFALLHGVPGQPEVATLEVSGQQGASGQQRAPGSLPWTAQPGPRKFLCPVPGYDRHFGLTEDLGFELVPVPLNQDGPDVEAIRDLVTADPSIKGMWAVPMYSNPSGATYNEEVIRALVSMPTAAADFRIFWDNAYGLHHLSEDTPEVIDVLGLADEAGNPDRVLVFASTSKITFAGGGVSFFGASPANIEWFQKHVGAGSIGPDKINQLRHLKFFGDAEGVRAHMRSHKDIVWPKFRIVLDTLDDQLGGLGVAEWTHPTGGYFISVDVLPGTASRVVELAKSAGVALTPAGSAFPYGTDPQDTNIRLAPSFPTESDVSAAARAFATCVRVAAIENLQSA